MTDRREAKGGMALVLPCRDLDDTMAFFVERLGMRLRWIFPADDPAVAVLEGRGVTLRLERERIGDPGVLAVESRSAADPEIGTVWTAPNGTRVEWGDPSVPLPDLQPEFVLTRRQDSDWVVGRAGMQYRDLIPGRLGGRFIASHIRIEQGGPVPDYVHFHEVRLQLIFCVAGWVKVVYEDQGPAFVMRPGDCVLQPPGIRHRVLECSDGLEVVEVGCPASHPTGRDHELELPNVGQRPERRFGGQKFVRSVGSGAISCVGGTLDRDLGVAAATDGLAGASVHSLVASTARRGRAAAEFHFVFVLDGELELETDAGRWQLRAGDACCLPPGVRWEWLASARGGVVLEVLVPG